MGTKRWRKQPKRIDNEFIGRALEFILMELETEGLSPEIYRYQTRWGINVVYYILDIQQLEEGIIEPLYFEYEEVYSFGKSEDALFDKILENTVSIMQTRLIPFYVYLRELEDECEDALIPVIQTLVGIMIKIKKDNWLWCVTSSLKERGATGAFYKPLLRIFCETNQCKRLLLGFGNNDYTFMAKINSNTISAISDLGYGVGSIRKDSRKIIQRKMLIYDYDLDSFEEFKDMQNH